MTSLDSISDVAEGRTKNDSKKSSENQATQNQEPFLSENLYENYFSAALIHHEIKISAGFR